MRLLIKILMLKAGCPCNADRRNNGIFCNLGNLTVGGNSAICRHELESGAPFMI
jgi:hypothetical protein